MSGQSPKTAELLRGQFAERIESYTTFFYLSSNFCYLSTINLMIVNLLIKYGNKRRRFASLVGFLYLSTNNERMLLDESNVGGGSF